MEWISVNDRVPDKNGAYIVSDGKDVFPAYIVDDSSILSKSDGDIFCYHYDDGLFERYYKGCITHWMPLPEPPMA